MQCAMVQSSAMSGSSRHIKTVVSESEISGNPLFTADIIKYLSITVIQLRQHNCRIPLNIYL